MPMLSHALLRAVLGLSLAAAAIAACSGSQSYVLSVSTSFSPATLATVPDKAVLPVIVAVAHTANFNLFKNGDLLTDPVAEVVRTGRTEDLERELDRLISSSDHVSSYSFFDDPDTMDISRLEIKVKDSASMISLIVPLSPSPSWFSGIPAFDLCAGDRFVEERANIVAKNFDSGLDSGDSFMDDPHPFPKGQKIPVGPEDNIGDATFVTLALEKGTLGVDWWKIFLGVLSAVAVLLLLFFFVLPRFRKKRPAELPLTAQDGVGW